MNQNTSVKAEYPAKLLLFGEYTVINGSEAMAIPYKILKGMWENEKGYYEFRVESNKILQELLQFIENNSFMKSKIDTIQFSNEIKEGLWFDSNIPTGYGLGSSGSLCAAIYDRFWKEKSINYKDLMHNLALIEGYFHGQSSGIDPMVSYLKKTIVLNSKNEIDILEKFEYEKLEGKGAVFIIDTGVSRRTTPLVAIYKDLSTSPDFVKGFTVPMKELVSQAIIEITNTLVKDRNNLMETFKEISKLQYVYLGKMILDDFSKLWEEGISSNQFYLKLCGAGGGGFILGITRNWDEFKSEFNSLNIRKIFNT
jgi:mevalonate kinase